MGFKDFIQKVKDQAEESKYKRKTEDAKNKGFSSLESYVIQTNTARKEGFEKAQKELRDKERKRVKKEEYDLRMEEARLGRGAKAAKIQRKVQKGMSYINEGAKVYNDIMMEIKGATTGYNSQPRQRKRYKPKNKKQKGKRRKSRKRDSNDLLLWASRY